jgi:hypothetical protein
MFQNITEKNENARKKSLFQNGDKAMNRANASNGFGNGNLAPRGKGGNMHRMRTLATPRNIGKGSVSIGLNVNLNANQGTSVVNEVGEKQFHANHNKPSE